MIDMDPLGTEEVRRGIVVVAASTVSTVTAVAATQQAATEGSILGVEGVVVVAEGWGICMRVCILRCQDRMTHMPMPTPAAAVDPTIAVAPAAAGLTPTRTCTGVGGGGRGESLMI